uniref:Mediator of RNA polymerase II transcription subunit 24 n=1 Tax=Steinernema glaseri TaxID=37863 RepID=A0A1I7Z791_9BILA
MSEHLMDFLNDLSQQSSHYSTVPEGFDLMVANFSLQVFARVCIDCVRQRSPKTANHITKQVLKKKPQEEVEQIPS